MWVLRSRFCVVQPGTCRDGWVCTNDCYISYGQKSSCGVLTIGRCSVVQAQYDVSISEDSVAHTCIVEAMQD